MIGQRQPIRPFSRLDFNNIEDVVLSQKYCFAGIP
jgi:hypothetical protein